MSRDDWPEDDGWPEEVPRRSEQAGASGAGDEATGGDGMSGGDGGLADGVGPDDAVGAGSSSRVGGAGDGVTGGAGDRGTEAGSDPGDPLHGLWDDAPPRGRRRPPGRRGPAPDRPRDPVRATIRGLGQLLITAGVVVLLFVVYEIWVTNLFGEQKQAQATEALDKLWASESDVVTAPDRAVVTQSGGTVVVTAPGEPDPTAPGRQRHYDTTEGVGFAKMYVPSFGADFVLTIIEGTTQADLYAGPGHYQGTQYPGQPGNFAMAGHRVNKGAPFDDLGLLQSCDAIVIETVDDWYVYRVLPMQDEVADWARSKHAHCAGVHVQTGRYAGVYGREITVPSDYPQVLPVPHVNNTVVPDDAERLITLTTCHPKFSDAQRMIIHGILVKSYPKKAGFLPPQLQETS